MSTQLRHLRAGVILLLATAAVAFGAACSSSIPPADHAAHTVHVVATSVPTRAAVPAAPLPITRNTRYVQAFLEQHKFKPAGAAGIAAELYEQSRNQPETGLVPKSIPPPMKCFGIACWTSWTWPRVVAYAKLHHEPVATLKTQLEFILHDMVPQTMAQLKASTDVEGGLPVEDGIYGGGSVEIFYDQYIHGYPKGDYSAANPAVALAERLKK